MWKDAYGAMMLHQSERLSKESIHSKPRMIRMPEREDLHVLLPRPGLPHRRVREGAERHRHPRLKSKLGQGPQGLLQILRLQLKDEIEIQGRGQLSMEHHGHSTYDEVPDSQPFERRQDPLYSTVHAWSLLRPLRQRGTFNASPSRRVPSAAS